MFCWPVCSGPHWLAATLLIGWPAWLTILIAGSAFGGDRSVFSRRAGTL
jgi:hypothetical protein